MRRYWKPIAGITLFIFGIARWIIDIIGKAQVVSDLPIVRWILHPYFPPVAFVLASVLVGWGYYDIAVRKHPAGFIGEPERRDRLVWKSVAWVGLVILGFVGGPLAYSRWHRKHPIVAQSSRSNPPEKKSEDVSTSKEVGGASTQTASKTTNAAANSCNKKPISRKHGQHRKQPAQPVPTEKIASKQQPAVSQTCNNGICIGGENSGTATVNNYVPTARHLTTDQIAALDAFALSMPEDAKNWFTVESINTPECVTYGDEIQRIFKNRDRTVASVVIWLTAGPPLPTGVVVAVSSEQDEHFSVAQNVANKLSNLGLPDVKFTRGTRLKPGQVKVIVGVQE